jgi:hypothetical protein
MLVLAACASEVHGSGCCLSKLKRRFLAWSSKLFDDPSPRPSYAFMIFNKVVVEENQQRINDLRPLPRNPDRVTVYPI